jgi:hypothetical protein
MRKSWIAAVMALVLLPIFAVQACGPDFSPDVFVRKLRPDQPKEFAAGKLGVLLPTYPRMDLIVAFRYLNGGVLSVQEQAAYAPTYTEMELDMAQQSNAGSDDQASNKVFIDWDTLHEKYAGHSPNVQISRNVEVKTAGGYTYQSSYVNCNEDAFHNAALTLQSRAQSWGSHSALLTDWVQGQDAVFTNCSGEKPALPAAAPADAPALLKADRAYQTAAALFYVTKFDEARNAFAAIRKDAASPWQGIAGYLEARCLVRQAFLPPPAAPQNPSLNYDAVKMKEAAVLLQSLLKEKHAGISHEAIERELNLVCIRIEPLARVRELAASLAGPAADSNYKQNLTDMAWFLNQKLDSLSLRAGSGEQSGANYNDAYKQTAELRTTAPLVDWAVTLQSPAPEAKAHALAEWQKTPTLYWLMAAMIKANGKDDAAPKLMASAARVENASPAWETLTYHRARLLLETDKSDEARQLLDQTLPQLRATHRDSSVNLYQTLRTSAAKDLNEFLQSAPQKILLRSSEAGSSSDECLGVMKENPKRKYDCAKTVDANQFNDAAAVFFNAQAPLSVLIEAAKSNALPQQLRQAVAMMAWTRSLLLKDDAAANELLPLLPAQLQKQAGVGAGFSAVLALARNPGLRPYLEAGVQRSYSYDFVESYRDNWWCTGLQSNWATSQTSLDGEPVTFLTGEQRQAAAKQLDLLRAQDGAKLYLGNMVLAYVKEHADDRDAPEALYLVLRMIRYGCDRQLYSSDGKPSEEVARVDALKKDVARLIRQRYAASPWTKKAAPFTG